MASCPALQSLTLAVFYSTTPVYHAHYRSMLSKSLGRLLDEVSGFVAPGKLTALMGESGAGKVGLAVTCARATLG